MCIRIFNCDSSLKYDSSKPLEDQLINSQKVVIDYDPKDLDIDRFMNEMKKLVRNGIDCNIHLDMIHNDYIKGAKVKQQIKKLKKDLNLNEAIKLLVNIHSELDKQLESISTFCREK